MAEFHQSFDAVPSGIALLVFSLLCLEAASRRARAGSPPVSEATEATRLPETLSPLELTSRRQGPRVAD